MCQTFIITCVFNKVYEWDIQNTGVDSFSQNLYKVEEITFVYFKNMLARDHKNILYILYMS